MSTQLQTSYGRVLEAIREIELQEQTDTWKTFNHVKFIIR